MPSRPPVIKKAEIWRDGEGNDPAKYLIEPGSVKIVPGGEKVDPGNLRHARPYITNGRKLFVFPVGAEGFRKSGSATLGLHRNIGDDDVTGMTVHRREGRIILEGMFPGVTAQDNMVECEAMLVSVQRNGLALHVPGVFDNEQMVLPDTWDFSHDRDDRTHSIDYTITFVKIGIGQKLPDPHGKPPHQNPSVKTKPRGKPHRVFVIKAGVRTFRGIANVVYKNPDAWHKIVKLNEGQLNNWKRHHPNVPNHQLPTYRWPIGTKFRY
jgi:hypothetical protein